MKNLFKLLGYEPIYKRPTEFQSLILQALKEMTVREVAVIAQTSLPTVQRWASGQSAPLKSFEKHIMNAIRPEMLRREDELWMRCFGHVKKRD